MGTSSVYVGTLSVSSEEFKFSFLERLILRVVHPRFMVFYIIGGLWIVFGLWRHDWLMAASALVVSRALGYISVRHADLSKIADTTLGKIALLHLNPVNLTLQTAGVFLALFGIWQHQVFQILSGLSLLFLGHGLGWENVHPSFKLKY